MTQSKHTPTPWRLENRDNTTIGAGKQVYIFGQDVDERLPHNGAFVCGVPETRRHNAAFIVQACNAHEPILELIKNAVNQLDAMDFSASANWNGSIKTNIALLLNAALAKAKGEA